ncbi:MAG TPA: hypothetical protein VFY29_14410 [Terriglobia bacterium]|nr:hypothetical protein [Terriglobia bacterium]
MDQKTMELVVSALQAQKIKLESAIAELKATLNGRTASKAVAAATPIITVRSAKAGERKAKRTMTAAGRKALSEAARRRWAKAKKAGTSTL